jgi:hypothetical protein
MANLLNQNIGTNYKGILNLNTLNGNLSGTLQAVTDGDGNASPLTLSTGEVGISRTIALSAGATNVRLINETYTINNSGAQTGNVTGIFLNATETALNGMGHNLMDLQNGGVSMLRVLRLGQLSSIGYSIDAARFRFNNQNFNINYGYIQGNSNGVFSLIDNTEANFNRLQFGGTTNAFPAIARQGSTANMVICSADATANTSLGVGMSAATALNASAILQADSTTRGFLPPRMTTTEKNAIVTPAAGLVIYDTTLAKLCVRTASAWETVTSI